MRLPGTVKFGIIAGILMAAFLSLFSISGSYGGSPLRFFKYLLLMIVLSIFFYNNRPDELGRKYVFYHIPKTVTISFIAAIITVIANLLLYNIDPVYSFNKFNLTPTEGQSFFMINFSIFFEMLVVGIISGFVIFPIFKNRDSKLESESLESLESRTG